jgi:enoyl-CoA hydratase
MLWRSPRRNLRTEAVVNDENDIILEVEGVTVVRLNRPNRLNALTQLQVVDLHQILDRIGADQTCRVVIITGTGRGFCAGVDLHASVARNKDKPDDLMIKLMYQENFGLMAKRIRMLRQPVIAAVNGPAAGADMALALAADIRIAARSAKFLIAAVKIGLTAGEAGISFHLPRLIGASRAFETMLTGRPVNADEADRVGLVSLVVDDELLMGKALGMAETILANSPYSTQHTKRIMWTNLEASSLDAALDLENRTQILATMTNDFHEASRAFTEKRKPRFTGY